MKHVLLALSVAIGAWMLSPTLEGQPSSWSTSTAKAKNDQVKKGKKPNAKKGKKSKGGSFHSPAFDPNVAGSAMVLLLGGMAYIASRRHEEDVA